jgi:hypothetical protein
VASRDRVLKIRLKCKEKRRATVGALAATPRSGITARRFGEISRGYVKKRTPTAFAFACDRPGCVVMSGSSEAFEADL